MSPSAVTARLREALEAGRREPKRPQLPMDAASITARLRSVSELRDLCLKLGRIGKNATNEANSPDT